MPPNDFFDHFQNLYLVPDMFVNEDVKNYFSNEDATQIKKISQLDQDFNILEDEKAISCLKKQKSGEVDLLISEIFIESNTILSPISCRLFNFMYNHAIYPDSWTDSWTKGITVAVPKKGNINNINNYRGITLTSILQDKWSEENHILSDSKYGFRKDRSTINCIYVLHLVISKLIIAEKRK